MSSSDTVSRRVAKSRFSRYLNSSNHISDTFVPCPFEECPDCVRKRDSSRKLDRVFSFFSKSSKVENNHFIIPDRTSWVNYSSEFIRIASYCRNILLLRSTLRYFHFLQDRKVDLREFRRLIHYRLTSQKLFLLDDIFSSFCKDFQRKHFSNLEGIVEQDVESELDVFDDDLMASTADELVGFDVVDLHMENVFGMSNVDFHLWTPPDSDEGMPQIPTMISSAIYCLDHARELRSAIGSSDPIPDALLIFPGSPKYKSVIDFINSFILNRLPIYSPEHDSAPQDGCVRALTFLEYLAMLEPTSSSVFESKYLSQLEAKNARYQDPTSSVSGVASGFVESLVDIRRVVVQKDADLTRMESAIGPSATAPFLDQSEATAEFDGSYVFIGRFGRSKAPTRPPTLSIQDPLWVLDSTNGYVTISGNECIRLKADLNRELCPDELLREELKEQLDSSNDSVIVRVNYRNFSTPNSVQDGYTSNDSNSKIIHRGESGVGGFSALNRPVLIPGDSVSVRVYVDTVSRSLFCEPFFVRKRGTKSIVATVMTERFFFRHLRPYVENRIPSDAKNLPVVDRMIPTPMDVSEWTADTSLQVGKMYTVHNIPNANVDTEVDPLSSLLDSSPSGTRVSSPKPESLDIEWERVTDIGPNDVIVAVPHERNMPVLRLKSTDRDLLGMVVLVTLSNTSGEWSMVDEFISSEESGAILDEDVSPSDEITRNASQLPSSIVRKNLLGDSYPYAIVTSTLGPSSSMEPHIRSILFSRNMDAAMQAFSNDSLNLLPHVPGRKWTVFLDNYWAAYRAHLSGVRQSVLDLLKHSPQNPRDFDTPQSISPIQKLISELKQRLPLVSNGASPLERLEDFVQNGEGVRPTQQELFEFLSDQLCPSTVKHSPLLSRRDLRLTHNVCSIDPPGCTDIDDAISVRMLPRCPHTGLERVELGVHIADVSHFVRAETALDKEAEKRGTSVYLNDRRLDMLPSLLSENTCSIRARVDRFAFSVLWVLRRHALNCDLTKDEPGKYESRYIRKCSCSGRSENALEMSRRYFDGLSEDAQKRLVRNRHEVIPTVTDCHYELDESLTWIGKTIIRTRCAFTYKQADVLVRSRGYEDNSSFSRPDGKDLWMVLSESEQHRLASDVLTNRDIGPVRPHDVDDTTWQHLIKECPALFAAGSASRKEYMHLDPLAFTKEYKERVEDDYEKYPEERGQAGGKCGERVVEKDRSAAVGPLREMVRLAHWLARSRRGDADIVIRNKEVRVKPKSSKKMPQLRRHDDPFACLDGESSLETPQPVEAFMDDVSFSLAESESPRAVPRLPTDELHNAELEFFAKEGEDINDVIMELMVFANWTVAAATYQAFPDCSFVRTHRPPLRKDYSRFLDLVRGCLSKVPEGIMKILYDGKESSASGVNVDSAPSALALESSALDDAAAVEPAKEVRVLVFKEYCEVTQWIGKAFEKEGLLPFLSDWMSALSSKAFYGPTWKFSTEVTDDLGYTPGNNGSESKFVVNIAFLYAGISMYPDLITSHGCYGLTDGDDARFVPDESNGDPGTLRGSTITGDPKSLSGSGIPTVDPQETSTMTENKTKDPDNASVENDSDLESEVLCSHKVVDEIDLFPTVGGAFLNPRLYSVPPVLSHFGLMIPIYTHFTSPIRRYPDVIVHRLTACLLGIDVFPDHSRDSVAQRNSYAFQKLNEVRLFAVDGLNDGGTDFFDDFLSAKWRERETNELKPVTLRNEGAHSPFSLYTHEEMADTADLLNERERNADSASSLCLEMALMQHFERNPSLHKFTLSAIIKAWAEPLDKYSIGEDDEGKCFAFTAGAYPPYDYSMNPLTRDFNLYLSGRLYEIQMSIAVPLFVPGTLVCYKRKGKFLVGYGTVELPPCFFTTKEGRNMFSGSESEISKDVKELFEHRLDRKEKEIGKDCMPVRTRVHFQFDTHYGHLRLQELSSFKRLGFEFENNIDEATEGSFCHFKGLDEFTLALTAVNPSHLLRQGLLKAFFSSRETADEQKRRFKKLKDITYREDPLSSNSRASRDKKVSIDILTETDSGMDNVDAASDATIAPFEERLDVPIPPAPLSTARSLLSMTMPDEPLVSASSVHFSPSKVMNSAMKPKLHFENLKLGYQGLPFMRSRSSASTASGRGEVQTELRSLTKAMSRLNVKDIEISNVNDPNELDDFFEAFIGGNPVTPQPVSLATPYSTGRQVFGSLAPLRMLEKLEETAEERERGMGALDVRLKEEERQQALQEAQAAGDSEAVKNLQDDRLFASSDELVGFSQGPHAAARSSARDTRSNLGAAAQDAHRKADMLHSEFGTGEQILSRNKTNERKLENSANYHKPSRRGRGGKK